MSGNDSATWSPVTLAVASLVLDPGLQCRAQVDQATVEEYAEAMAAGATFPAIRVVRVDEAGSEVLLVVDGWHRVLAARRAERAELAGELLEGTRREALLEAVRANAHHGLKRGHEDKRRAVRSLLQDPEWAKLSNRDAGELAGVSHAFVGQVRRHFGVEKGQVLTEARIEEVDGELPLAWRQLLDQHRYSGDRIRKARAARSLKELGKVTNPTESYNADVDIAAGALRLEELATEPWPWSDDETPKARQRRARILGTERDLEAALVSVDCPDRGAVFLAWSWARRLPKLTESWLLERALKAAEKRPALEEQIRARMAELQQERGSQPWVLADALRETSWEEWPLALQDCDSVDVLRRVASSLPTNGDDATTRRADVRSRVEELGTAVVDCPNPRCGGWSLGESFEAAQDCVRCKWRPVQTRNNMVATLETAGALVSAGLALEVEGVVVGREAARFAASLRACHDLDPKALVEWLLAGPATVQEQAAALLGIELPAWNPASVGPDPADVAPEPPVEAVAGLSAAARRKRRKGADQLDLVEAAP